jgi:hypothetical protein
MIEGYQEREKIETRRLALAVCWIINCGIGGQKRPLTPQKLMGEPEPKEDDSDPVGLTDIRDMYFRKG